MTFDPLSRRNMLSIGGAALASPLAGSAAQDAATWAHADSRGAGSQLSLWDFVTPADRAALVSGTATPDLTQELQAAANAAVAQRKTLHLPGTHARTDIKISAPIEVTGPLRISGDGEGVSRILCVDCDGFSFGPGVGFFSPQGFNIALAQRHAAPDGAIRPNTHAAFRVSGATGRPCHNFHFRRIFIDGFGYGVLGDFLCQSSFDISAIYVGNGIWLRGQSVNNVVLGTSQISGVDSIGTASAPGSVGIRVGNLDQPQPEGFMVQPGTLVFGFRRALWVHGAINVAMTGVICDGISEYVVLDESSDTVPGFGNNYTDNYCGIAGNCTAAFLIRATAAAYRHDNRGTTIRNNEIAIYANASLDYGYRLEGDFIENVSIIDGKLIRGRDRDGSLIETRQRDCLITGGRGHRVSGNVWNASTGFETRVPVQYEGNAGLLAGGGDLVFRYEAGQRVTYGVRAPVAGIASVGDRHVNTAPAAGGVMGWICVAGGSPGIWKASGVIGT